MLANIKKALFLVSFSCSPVYSGEFSDFKNELSIWDRNAIASSCVRKSFDNEKKIVDTAIHVTKGQHLKAVEEIVGSTEIPLCIPIKCSSDFLDFVGNFYLMFDRTEKRQGVLTRLDLYLQTLTTEEVDRALKSMNKTLSLSYLSTLKSRKVEKIQEAMRGGRYSEDG